MCKLYQSQQGLLEGSFPLPKIDLSVDATTWHDRMSFLDALQGYHQIALLLEDWEKTAFITPLEIYCYKVMSYGLKNAEAIDQRMATKMFKHQLGKSMEVYIDDMVIKSRNHSPTSQIWRRLFKFAPPQTTPQHLQMCTQCRFGGVPWVSSLLKGNWGKSWSDYSCPRITRTTKSEGGSTPNQDDYNFKSLYI